MHDIKKTACFTGYPPSNLPFLQDETDLRYIQLKKLLNQVITDAAESGYSHYICGFDQGVDMLCAEIIIGLKKRAHITLESAIPYENQAVHWAENERERYYGLLSDCDIETMLQTHYTSDCYIRRNKYMVDHSSLVIAVYDGQFGGTMQTLIYTRAIGKRIICIDPQIFKINKM